MDLCRGCTFSYNRQVRPLSIRDIDTEDGLNETMSRYSVLREDRRQFLALTGVPPEEFEQFLRPFVAAETTRDGLDPVEECPVDDQLLLIWLHARRRANRPDLAALFGLTTGQVEAWIDRLSPVFAEALTALTTTALPAGCIDFLRLANAQEVDYLIVGGQAVAFHGYLRPILDLDLFVATDLQNATKLTRALADFGHGVEPRVVECFQIEERVIRIGQPPFTVVRFVAGDRFIHFGRPPTQLELLTSISAVTFAECRAARVFGALGSVTVPYIGLEQLKANKRASIREKDADDLAHLP